MVNYPTLVTNWQIEGKIIASVLGRKFCFNSLFKLFSNYNFIFPFRRFVLLFLLLLSSSNATKDLQLFCKFYSYCKTSLSLLQAAFLSYPPPLCPQKSLQQIYFFFLSPSVLFVFVFASFQSIWIINLSLSAKRLKKLKAFPWDIFQNNFHNFSPVIATAAAASAGATGRPGSPITSLIVPIMSY